MLVRVCKVNKFPCIVLRLYVGINAFSRVGNAWTSGFFVGCLGYFLDDFTPVVHVQFFVDVA